MDVSIFILFFSIAIALLFDLVNGFHDAANSIATIVSTRVLTPFYAVLWAATFNFIAILIFAPKVADTISKIIKIEPNDLHYVNIILVGLLAAIAWNLLTWWLGLPTSSSHALIGGLAGAGIAHAGWDALQWNLVGDTVLFILLAPLLGFLLGFIFMCIMYSFIGSWSPSKVQGVFSRGQLISAAMYSIGHGANDAQKTMGVIVALLVAAGYLSADEKLSLSNSSTSWIILSCHLAMALGTAMGGWRIVKTMGMKIVKLKPVGGFCAETAGALTLFFATHFGIPVSTTHTITGAIIGVGSVSVHLSRIRWGIAANIVWAWFLTIPCAAFVAAFFVYVYKLIRLI